MSSFRPVLYWKELFLRLGGSDLLLADGLGYGVLGGDLGVLGLFLLEVDLSTSVTLSACSSRRIYLSSCLLFQGCGRAWPFCRLLRRQTCQMQMDLEVLGSTGIYPGW